MKFNDVVSQVGKLVTDNSPTLLTVIGVTGTVTTAVLTGKASYRAAQLIQAEEGMSGTAGDPTQRFKERLQISWKLYIPPATTGLLTIACIIGANQIGARRGAALAAAYTLSEKAFDQYKSKVVERVGQTKEQSIRDSVVQDDINQNPVSTREVIITGNGEYLCFDTFTGRYFESDVESLKKAQNDLNYRILSDMYASLGDFYNLIGLPTTAFSEEVGWNSDKLMELSFSTAMSDDNRPCLAISFNAVPIRDYYKLG